MSDDQVELTIEVVDRFTPAIEGLMRRMGLPPLVDWQRSLLAATFQATDHRPSPTVTLDDIRAAYERLAPPRPSADRIEVGNLAHAVLRAAVPTAPAAGLPVLGRSLPPWFGVRVVVNDRLDPGEWRLLTHEGELIRHGNVERTHLRPAPTGRRPAHERPVDWRRRLQLATDLRRRDRRAVRRTRKDEHHQ